MYINFHTKNRLKLSATYLSIIMFLSIVFSVAIYKVSSDQIKEDCDQHLREFHQNK